LDLLQPLVNGLLLGGLYAVIALGMATMFGIVRVVNLAHGDLMILAGYLSLVCLSFLPLDPLATLLIVAPVMYAIGYCLQRFLFNRVMGRAMEPPLLVAFGVAVVLQNLLLLVFTPDARSLGTELALKTIPVSASLSLPLVYLLDFALGVTAILVFHAFFRYTTMGRAIRAAADDAVGAGLVGIDTRRIYAHAMGVSMVSAALAGVLLGMTFPFSPHSGSQYLIIAFGVIVIGGLGSLKGTLAGGIVLAEAQLLGAHFTRPGHQLLIGYIVLLAVLAIRPKGLFGEK
jgi:branched-chain amino acid transport system permease protein